jgi:RNAse (barnase) inhibitor barstar
MPGSLQTNVALAGPYRITEDRLPDLLKAAAELPSTCNTWTITGKVVKPCLQKLGQQLGFPEHFGANFDALYDCLCDAEVIAAGEALIVIHQIDQWSEDDRDTLIAVFQAVSDEWREQNRCFWALFNDRKLDLDLLPSS